MGVALETLSPRLLASAESREGYEGVERAHREFLRIIEVTERISESRTCLGERDNVADEPEMSVECMLASQRTITSTWRKEKN